MHEIENMFAVGKAPWHGLGTVLDAPPTIEEALRLAGLDWEVGLEPLFLADGRCAPGQATVRRSDGKILGAVGPRFRPVQNTTAFQFFEPFVESGEVVLETAGSLRGGQRIWVLARIRREPLVIVPAADDTVLPFVLLANGHDATMAVRVGFTAVRTVCANTLAAALESSASRLLRVRHHARAAQALDEIRGVVDLAMRDFNVSAEAYRRLARVQVYEKDLRQYVSRVFQPAAARAADENVQKEADRLMEKITPLFERGRGNDRPGVAGTMWAAFNSVTEYLSHERGRDAGRRLDSSWFGDGAAINRRALQVGLEMAA